MQEQADNKPTTRLITIGGETKTVPQWAKKAGLSYNGIQHRLKLGLLGADLINPHRLPQKWRSKCAH